VVRRRSDAHADGRAVGEEDGFRICGSHLW
jgi:hypothetical protein